MTDHDSPVVMCSVAAEIVELLRGKGQFYERVRIWLGDDDVINIERCYDAASEGAE